MSVLAGLALILAASSVAVAPSLAAGQHHVSRHLVDELVRTQRAASGVVALASDDVWRVGAIKVSGQAGQTRARHWDGTRWRTIDTPNPGDRANYLAEISAVSPDELWSVGAYSNEGKPQRLLAMHWIGGRWIHTHVPQTGVNGYFVGVAGAAQDDVWAVGWHYPVGEADTLGVLDHWDGHSWSTAPGSPDLTKVLLLGVEARSTDDVWVVGGRAVGQRLRTLVLHWDGETWTTVPSPNVGPKDTLLRSVSALGPRDVWAVGESNNGADATPLTMHWNGHDWRIIRSPRFPDSNTYLLSVSAQAPDDVWAVGYDNPEGDLFTLIEHWDGSRWTRVKSPNPHRFNSLGSVSADSANDAWAVGSSSSGRVVTERWDGSAWRVVRSP